MKSIRKYYRSLSNCVRSLRDDEAGSNALEYGLIVGLVSLAIVVGATSAGAALGTLFTNIGTAISADAAKIPTS